MTLAIDHWALGASSSRRIDVHRFLRRSAFYPLLLCTLLSFSFLLARIYVTGGGAFRFLVWNLFLAWVPYGFSLAAIVAPRVWPGRRWRIACVWLAWLATFPNAPYIFTDMIHWQRAPLAAALVPWWYDLGLILMFALNGCFLAIVSLRIMHDLVRRAVGGAAGETLGWLFVVAATTLSGFGIFLGRFGGRFGRYNSWDLLLRPHHLASDIAGGLSDPLSHGRSIGVTLMFGTMLLVTYVMFVSMAQVGKEET
jgi:uncharacterized membrane protein